MNKPFWKGVLYGAIYCVLMTLYLAHLHGKIDTLRSENIQLIKEQIQLQNDFRKLTNEYLKQGKEYVEQAKEKIRLTEMLSASFMSSVYDADPQNALPLWPFPGNGRDEIYHFVDQVSELEGQGIPYQVYRLTNVETSIIEIGITKQKQSFPETSVLETKVGKIRVLDAEEADAVLRKFGRKK